MIEIQWIVCRGEERQVANGCVWCPTQPGSEQGHERRVEECLDCRHLVDTAVDRLPDGMCTTEP